MTNPRVHNFGMALLTPNLGLVVHDRVPPLSRGWQGVEDRQKTNPCPCHSDLIFWPFSRAPHTFAGLELLAWIRGSG